MPNDFHNLSCQLCKHARTYTVHAHRQNRNEWNETFAKSIMFAILHAKSFALLKWKFMELNEIRWHHRRQLQFEFSVDVKLVLFMGHFQRSTRRVSVERKPVPDNERLFRVSLLYSLNFIKFTSLKNLKNKFVMKSFVELNSFLHSLNWQTVLSI